MQAAFKWIKSSLHFLFTQSAGCFFVYQIILTVAPADLREPVSLPLA
ncbi:hypothetical protein QG041_09015 [Kingella kingae]|nr:hypothetical protein [Kingella kingae]MDK4569458.1 hypothetical protein [Kingella kingae]MDK4571421.1 hypothetical protein [Kingella kingae]MDK4573387.1 hypothetical protein [Kingella kingae]MDK4617460.1 hypothetical protein [Kingella kingae]MDK4657092.1 hypothetical protein [Kingella kingae]